MANPWHQVARQKYQQEVIAKAKLPTITELLSGAYAGLAIFAGQEMGAYWRTPHMGKLQMVREE